MDTVLVNRPIHPDALERLEGEAKVLTAYSASQAEAANMLVRVDALLLCAGWTIGAAEIALAPKLRVIGRHGVGLDNVDVEAASAHRIPVVYTPYGPTESTAEHTLMLIMATARRLAQLDRAVREGRFQIRNDFRAMGRELRGKALGVVGFGRIGRRVAEMCQSALDMRIYVFDTAIATQTIVEWGAIAVESLVELAQKVDVLTVHAPLTAATHHLVGSEVIRALGPQAILINASRGPVVDEDALIGALRENRIAGAGLDVYDPEPPTPDNPLFQLEQVVLTPHVASFTEEARRLMGVTVVEDILHVLHGEQPEYLVNPRIWQDRRLPSQA